jgi:uncharacterized protein (TIGR00297 family)
MRTHALAVLCLAATAAAFAPPAGSLARRAAPRRAATALAAKAKKKADLFGGGKFIKAKTLGKYTANALSAPAAIVVARSGVVPRYWALVPPALKTALYVNSALALAATFVRQKALTFPDGLAHAWALGVLLLASPLGRDGYALVLAYFVAGTAVTRVGKAGKEAAGIAEGRGGSRGPENVWGSAGAGAACALALAVQPRVGFAARYVPALRLAFVASFATKLSDTFASEIGKAYGKTPFLITTFKRVEPGTEGAVSLEGTAAGVAGSVLMAYAGVALGLCAGRNAVLACMGAAFVATNIESVLGATVQGKFKVMTNEVVNAINTSIGAALGFAASLYLGC